MAALDQKFEDFLRKNFPTFLEDALSDSHSDATEFFKLIGGKDAETCMLWAYLYLLKQLLRGRSTCKREKITEFVKIFRELSKSNEKLGKMEFVCLETCRQFVIGEEPLCGDADCCGMTDKSKYRIDWSWYFAWTKTTKPFSRASLTLPVVECLEFLEETTKPCYVRGSRRPAYKVVFERKNKKTGS